MCYLGISDSEVVEILQNEVCVRVNILAVSIPIPPAPPASPIEPERAGGGGWGAVHSSGDSGERQNGERGKKAKGMDSPASRGMTDVR